MVRGGDRASTTEFGLDRDHGFRADSASVARRSRDYLARRAQSRGSFRELRAPDGGVGTTSLCGNNDAGPLSVNRGEANLEPSASLRAPVAQGRTARLSVRKSQAGMRTGRRPESDQEGQTSFVSGVPSKPAIGRRLGSVPSRSPTEASG